MASKVYPIILLTLLVHNAIEPTHGNENNSSSDTPDTTVCPSRGSISPCTCDLTLDADEPLLSLSCSGVASQLDIDRTFSVLNQAATSASASAAGNERNVVIGRFVIVGGGGGDFEELDLTPFFNSTIKSLEISGFRRIHGNGSAAGSQGAKSVGSIHVTDLRIRGSVTMTNSGLVDVFPYFSQNLVTLAVRLSDLSSTKHSILSSNVSGSSSEEIEFFPGFSRFIYLRELYLGYFQSPAVISGGQFKRNGNLRHLDLSESTGLRIGPNAFVLDPPTQNLTSEEYLCINLIGNNLTETSFHSADNVSCFHGTQRPTMIDLSYNKLRFLERRHFRGFLIHNDANTIEASANSFVCGDERMTWLRESRAQFQTQVTGLFCSDDPAGATVFTSNVTIH